MCWVSSTAPLLFFGSRWAEIVDDGGGSAQSSLTLQQMMPSSGIGRDLYFSSLLHYPVHYCC